MTRSARNLVALLASLVLIISACGSSDDSDESSTDEGSDEQATEAETDDASTDDEAEDEGVAEDLGDMGDPVNITFGFGFPEGHQVHQEKLIPWAEEINELTDGTVTIEFFPGGQLGPLPEEYERVVSNVQDAGWGVPSYAAGRFPLTTVIENPFLFGSAVEATEALWDLYEEFPELQEEYGDTKTLALFTHDPGSLWSSSGVVGTIAEVEGMQLRSPGPGPNAIVEAIGATPVNMPISELADAMDRGVVDGTVLANEGVHAYSLVPLIDSVIVCNCYVLNFFVSVNLDVWDSLSPAQQAAIESVSGREFSVDIAANFDRDGALALEEAREAGVEFFDLEGEDADVWQSLGDEVGEEWVTAHEANGPSREMYDRLIELTNEG